MRDPLNGSPPEAPKPATIYDVAERANVSIKTVSKVINNLPEVSRLTRSRVQAVIEELSYRPNQLARGLASQRSFMVGLFCDAPAAGSGYIARIQMAILTMCQKEGYHLIVECIHATNQNIAQQVHALVAQSKLAGVVLTPPLSDLPTLIDALKATGTPIVRFSPEAAVPDVIDVDIDNCQAAYDITKYLIGLGHRRIGFIRGPLEHADARARYEGYCRAIAEADIPFLDEYCQTGNYTYRAGMLAGEKLLTLKDRPTAIFASNDDMASGVMASSIRYNLRLPQDLSVAGFDDAIFAHAMYPRLTTCRQPIADMAEAAFLALIHHGDKPIGPLTLPHKIIVRGSTARPPTA
ncbi:substrate-binding domain-containing protein [Rhizomicrobium electricum]|uniref:LacI family DNA-binding transcriptional regulator n=1 Tax=Rhizomicrobium electricum TaxID=480070 RepID=A0ABN1F4E2_9PROT|nr:LacI family transcriptional regulator [Rhizomicrobium electricum]